MKLINNIAKAHGSVSIFGRVGERTREGNDLYMEMKEFGLINEENIAESKVALVYGQMNELLGARMRVGLTDLTMAEYFCDINEQDILLFIDNIFRFIQAGSEVSTLLDIMPSAVGYQPTLIDPLDSTSTMLQPRTVGEEHYETVQRVKQTLQRYKELQDIIAILGLDELSEGDHLTVARARKIECFLSQLFFVAVFTGSLGKYVSLVETIRGFQLILSRELDSFPEQAFYLIGNIVEDTAKAMNLEVERKLKK
ncbi:unnamed protein product [Victoria cruziana]